MRNLTLAINVAFCVAVGPVAENALAGGELSFQAVALSGQLAPETGRIFSYFYPPVISDSGRVAFAGWLTGNTANDQGLWSGMPGSIQLVAREGSAAPGTGAVFTSNGWLSPWVNSTGVVAFSSALIGAGVDSTNNTGIWAGPPGAVTLVARAGNPAPGTPEGVVFSGGMQNWLMLNDAGEVVFRANLSGSGVQSSNDAGIWAGLPGALQLIAREGDVAPGTDGALFGPFNDQFAPQQPVPVLNAAGEVVFAGYHGSGRGIWRWSGGVLELVTRTGSSAYGMSGTFDNVYDPWMNSSGNVVFKASVVGDGIDVTNDSGIWTGVPGAVELVVRKGNPAPGAGGYYLALGFSNVGLLSIDDGGFITFPSSIFASDGVPVPNGGGVWRYGTPGPGTWAGSNLVLHGMPAPGLSGVTIGSVWALSPYPESSMPFPAYLSGTGVTSSNNESYWLKDVGSPPVMIAREGDLFDIGGGVVRSINGLNVAVTGDRESCYNSTRQMVIGLGFTDGSSGIFTANVPVPAIPGDMNCDSAVNGLDVDAFALAVLDPLAYDAEFTDCDIVNGDINMDGNTDIGDADSFVTCALNGGCP